MPFKPPTALMRRLIPLSLLLLMSGCVGIRVSPPILDALACNQLIPDSYRQPVASAGLLSPTETVGQLATQYDEQTSNLNQANGHTADLVKIADLCESQQRAVLNALNPPPWYDRLFKKAAK